MRRIRDPKSVRLKDRDYDVTPNIIAHMYPQIRNGSVKECEVEMVGEECEVYCEDGRRRGPWVGARWKRGMMRVARAPTSMHRVKG